MTPTAIPPKKNSFPGIKCHHPPDLLTHLIPQRLGGEHFDIGPVLQYAQFDLAEIGDDEAQDQRAVGLLFHNLFGMPDFAAQPAGPVRVELQSNFLRVTALEDPESAVKMVLPEADRRGSERNVGQAHLAHAPQVEFAPVAPLGAQGQQNPAAHIVLQVNGFDQTQGGAIFGGGKIMEGQLPALNQRLGDKTKGFSFGRRVALPDGGKGGIDPFLIEAELAGGRQHFAAERPDGAADNAAGAAGEQISGQQNRQQFVLADLAGRQVEALIGIKIALFLRIVFDGSAETVPHEFNGAVSGPGADFEMAGHGAGIGETAMAYLVVKPEVTLEFEMFGHRRSFLCGSERKAAHRVRF